MNRSRTLILVFFMMLVWGTLKAQQTQLMITAIDSLNIPHPYDHVMQQPNGNLQFYKLTYGVSSIDFYGFQYLIQSNVFTPQVNLATESGLQALNIIDRTLYSRFGNLYIIHKLGDTLGVFKLNANTVTYRHIDEFTFSQQFCLSNMADIVAENAIVVALQDSLVYYNFESGDYHTLLSGPEYIVDDMQGKSVIGLPDTHFIYVKDSMNGNSNQAEDWFIFDSEGNYLLTQSTTDLRLSKTILSPQFTKNIHGKWYISCQDIVNADGWLELHFANPDSLSWYFFVSPTQSLGSQIYDLYPFSDNCILTAVATDIFSGINYHVYANDSPIAQNPNATMSLHLGNRLPAITAVSEDITTISTVCSNELHIEALWTRDFPDTHSFIFPIATNQCIMLETYTYSDTIYVISESILYLFSVTTASISEDPLLPKPEIRLLAYPNPIHQGQELVIKSQYTTSVDIYNLRGQRIKTLEMDSSGKVLWDLRDSESLRIPSGIYLIKQRDSKKTLLKKIIIID